MADSDSDEESLQLSAQALSALQEFYAERQLNEEAASPSVIEENWQLSQFWYDEVTAATLAEECLRASGVDGSIACISCPTLYNKLLDIKPPSSSRHIILLEYDKRFSIHGDCYVFYDYNHPLDLPSSLTEGRQFDLVAADPPFLSEECLTNTAHTIKHLTKDKILLCTGSVMEGLAERLLGVRRCDSFTPGHTHNLANQFSCYTNYNSPLL